ncbi:UNVERIFIED_CONTAM: hypothetical protein K2H54_010807 [Gekko kuhli]
MVSHAGGNPWLGPWQSPVQPVGLYPPGAISSGQAVRLAASAPSSHYSSQMPLCLWLSDGHVHESGVVTDGRDEVGWYLQHISLSATFLPEMYPQENKQNSIGS